VAARELPNRCPAAGDSRSARGSLEGRREQAARGPAGQQGWEVPENVTGPRKKEQGEQTRGHGSIPIGKVCSSLGKGCRRKMGLLWMRSRTASLPGISRKPQISRRPRDGNRGFVGSRTMAPVVARGQQESSDPLTHITSSCSYGYWNSSYADAQDDEPRPFKGWMVREKSRAGPRTPVPTGSVSPGRTGNLLPRKPSSSTKTACNSNQKPKVAALNWRAGYAPENRRTIQLAGPRKSPSLQIRRGT